jgi:asparaginyl-tRNA synthetase
VESPKPKDPIITASDAEGAGEMFRVSTMDPQNPPLNEAGAIDYTQDFFGRRTNLTVSGQLEAEAFALAFKDVYTFGPTFRAENSNTARHAAEFWMIEPEIAFADLQDNMRLAEEMVKFLIAFILKQAPEEMEFFNSFVDQGLLARLKQVMDADFARITYTQAIEVLQETGEEFEYPVLWGADLQSEHERYLTEKILKKPVFVTDYPKDIKAFYMRQNDDGKTVAAMDLLVPGVGEIIGGSQREERLEYLEKRMQELQMSGEDLWWYLELRKYGGVKHAGFGLGFERLIMYLTGISNIRDVIPFPRTVKSCEF